MPDNLTKDQRSYNMSRIRSSKTNPEIKVGSALRLLGFAYQPKGIYGRPDFVNRKEKIVVFVDGCFWHGCSAHYKKPRSNKAYWSAKIKRNTARDKAVNLHLRSNGWRIIRIWEHSISD